MNEKKREKINYEKLNVRILQHPLARHLLTHLRDKNTKPPLFRTLTKKITILLAIEASKCLKMKNKKIETPLEPFEGEIIAEDIVVIPIMRAGIGMIEPIVDLFPNVKVGYIGVQRDERTAMPVTYYSKFPKLKNKKVFVIDPMLATGGSASFAISLVKQGDPESVVLLTIVSAPEGVNKINKDHPDVVIFTCSVDRELNSSKFILPGLGDFGDRLYGTE